MSFKRARQFAAPLAVGVAALSVCAGSASAATATPFGCRASDTAVRPASPLPTVEPYVANPAENPCADDQAGVSQATTSAAAVGSASTAGPAGAYTNTNGGADAAALASVDGGALNGTTASVQIVGPAQAQATYACVNGAVSASGFSNVTAAVINGQTVQVSSPGAQQTEQLGGGSYVTINQQLQTGTSLTERLALLHIAGVGDYVLGEAQVTQPATNPCAGGSGAGLGSGSGSGSGSGGARACPSGSSLVASAQLCEILSGGSATHSIVVSKPFAGPTGASVISLAAARKRYKSACLTGKGPNFVVLGTNGKNTIRLSKTRERVLGLGGNDKITVASGNNTCVAGGNGNDTTQAGNSPVTVNGGNGNDRIKLGNGKDTALGNNGRDVITAGKGNDTLIGGNGNDTITAGNGNDRVFGNRGADRLSVGTGKSYLFGDAGNDRLAAKGKRAHVNGGSGKNVAFAVPAAVKFARRHGCKTVHKLRIKA